MTDLSTIIAQIRELLPKVTPGPWQRSGVRQNINENCIMVGPDGFNILAIPHGRHPKDHAGAFVDAAYIALLNPSTVTALLDRIEELEKSNRELVDILFFGASTDSKLSEARAEALEEAARCIEEGFDRGIAKKQDKCPHDKFKWEDCESCAASAIRAMKSGGENG